MVQVEQNLGYCVLLSAAGGILEVFATAALAYPDAKKKAGNPWTPSLLKVCLLINVVLQILASVVGNLIGPWFGPISIVGPTFLSAQLVANMVIYGSLLGLESFTKDMRIGTSVIVTAAVLLPVVGPGVQSDQDPTVLMDTWYAHAWNATLIVGMLSTGLLLLLRSLGKVDALRSTPARYAVLLTARATSFAVNLSYSKVFALNPTLPWLVTSIVLKVLSGAVMTGSIVVQSTSVSQNTFVPLNATIVILVNALTGIIIWEDWRAMSSWLGYATVFVQLIVGNYLLLGEIDLFGPGNRRYGRRLLFRRIAGRTDLHFGSTSASTMEDDSERAHGELLDEEAAVAAGKRDEERGGVLIGGGTDEETGGDTTDADTDGAWSNDEGSSSRTGVARGELSDDLILAWMTASPSPSVGEVGAPDGEERGGDRRDDDAFRDNGAPAPSSASLPATTSACSTRPFARPPSLGHASVHKRQLSSGQRPRPSTVARRSVTTGSSAARAGATSSSSSPPIGRPSALAAGGGRRSQSTGAILSPRRRHFFGGGGAAHAHDDAAAEARREAWGQVFGVDRRWLDQRAANRTMEPIIEIDSGDLESVA